ncbi:MAG: hypothetical protein M0042_02105 [Nitrospiraceae bacterium]|nr:hypothetical protein [Nitrospiraceae bacterium]
MNLNRYEHMKRRLFGGYRQNAFDPLLKNRGAVAGPLQGSPEEFSQVIFELADGDVKKRNDAVSYEFSEAGRKHLLKFKDGTLFRAVKARSELGNALVVVTPYLPTMDDLVQGTERPLDRLVTDGLAIRDAFRSVANEYIREEKRLAAERATAEIRMARESNMETALATVEQARSGATIMIRGMQNIDALVRLGFAPCLVDNPDGWIDAEEVPGMRYHHEKSGIEVLLIAREKFRPIEELNRLELYFLILRSDGDRTVYIRMSKKFRESRADGSPYQLKAFHDDLIALAKYPEELKGRTEADLGLMADEVENVIDRRQELDKGILPYEAVFARNTKVIVDFIVQSRTSASEVRKALDYFEYTGMIDADYRMALDREIALVAAPKPAAPASDTDILYDKRVKEIVAAVLKKLPREHLTPKNITIAMAPYVNELGFGKLIKIRERILQLKEQVHMREEEPQGFSSFR